MVRFFAQNNLFNFKKRDTKNTKTNHYILLTNDSIKRCILLSTDRVLRGGGEEFRPDKYLTDTDKYYSSHDSKYGHTLK